MPRLKPEGRAALSVVLSGGVMMMAMPLIGRLYSGPIGITLTYGLILLGMVRAANRAWPEKAPEGVSEIVSIWSKQRGRITDRTGGEIVWNVLRTVVAITVIWWALKFESGFSSLFHWSMAVSIGLAIGFTSIELGLWSTFIVLLGAWMTARAGLQYDFNDPEAREVFLVAWRGNLLQLPWLWGIAACLTGPAIALLAIGSKATVATIGRRRRLAAERKQTARLLAERRRRRRAMEKQAKDVAVPAAVASLEKAEEELKAEAARTAKPKSTLETPRVRREDFLEREGGEVYCLNEMAAAGELAALSKILKRFLEAERLQGGYVDTAARQSFNKAILHIPDTWAAVLAASKDPDMVELRDYANKVAGFERAVASEGLLAGDPSAEDTTREEAGEEAVLQEGSKPEETAEQGTQASEEIADERTVEGLFKSARLPELDLGKQAKADPSRTGARYGAAQIAAEAKRLDELAEQAAKANAPDSGVSKAADGTDGAAGQAGHHAASLSSATPPTAGERDVGDMTYADMQAHALHAVRNRSLPNENKVATEKPGLDRAAMQALLDQKGGKEPIPDYDDAEVVQQLMAGHVVIHPVRNRDGRFAAPEIYAEHGVDAISAKYLMRTYRGYLEAEEGERDVAEILQNTDKLPAPVRAGVDAGIAAGWLFPQVMLEQLAIEAKGRTDSAPVASETDDFDFYDYPGSSNTEDSGYSAFDEIDGLGDGDATQDVSGGAMLVQSSDGNIVNIQPKVVEEIKLDGLAEKTSAALPEQLEATEASDAGNQDEPEVSPVRIEDLRRYSSFILMGRLQDDVLDEGAKLFPEVGPFAEAAGIDLDLAKEPFEAFQTMSRARMLQLRLDEAFQAADVAAVGLLLESRSEMDGYSLPDVSISTIETWHRIESEKRKKGASARRTKAERSHSDILAFAAQRHKISDADRKFVDTVLRVRLEKLGNLINAAFAGGEFDPYFADLVAEQWGLAREECAKALARSEDHPKLKNYVDEAIIPGGFFADGKGWEVVERIVKEAAPGGGSAVPTKRTPAAVVTPPEQPEAKPQPKKAKPAAEGLNIEVSERAMSSEEIARAVQAISLSNAAAMDEDTVRKALRVDLGGLYAGRSEQMLSVAAIPEGVEARVMIENEDGVVVGHVAVKFISPEKDQLLWFDEAAQKVWIGRWQNDRYTKIEMEADKLLVTWNREIAKNPGDEDTVLGILRSYPFVPDEAMPSLQQLSRQSDRPLQFMKGRDTQTIQSFVRSIKDKVSS